MSNLGDDSDLLGDFNILGITSVKMQTPTGYDKTEIARAETRINAYKTECGKRPSEFIVSARMVELKTGEKYYISYNTSEHTIFIKYKGYASMSILINAELRRYCEDEVSGEKSNEVFLSKSVWTGSTFITLLMLLKINIETSSCVSPKKILAAFEKAENTNNKISLDI